MKVKMGSIIFLLFCVGLFLPLDASELKDAILLERNVTR